MPFRIGGKCTDIMKPLKEFTIPFIGLKLGMHHYEYKIERSFFEHFEYEEFNDSDVVVAVAFDKKSTFMELIFQAKGTVNVNCDVITEPFDISIENDFKLVIKFGDEYNDENEEILVIPHGEYEVNIQQYIYELIVLAVPSKRVHPGVADGSIDSVILNKLEELHPREKDSKRTTEDIDPRWDKLKNLLNDKNK